MKPYPVPSEFTWKIEISSFDVGQNCLLRPSSQLRLQQEAGERHFEQGGLGYDELIRCGLTFVLVRLTSVIYRAPRLSETVNLVTWHRSPRGVQFYRCYQFLDADGNILIDSVSSFALVDPATHKLLRPSVFDQFGLTGQSERCSVCPDPVKLKVPQAMKAVGERFIRWSDIDYNGHVNNAVYADILCDNMPSGMNGKRIKSFSIDYMHEALEGDCLTLKTDDTRLTGENEAWVVGELGQDRCFEAYVRYDLSETSA